MSEDKYQPGHWYDWAWKAVAGAALAASALFSIITYAQPSAYIPPPEKQAKPRKYDPITRGIKSLEERTDDAAENLGEFVSDQPERKPVFPSLNK